MIREGTCPMCKGSKKYCAISENVKTFSYPCFIKRQRQVRTRRMRSPRFVSVPRKLNVMKRRNVLCSLRAIFCMSPRETSALPHLVSDHDISAQGYESLFLSRGADSSA